MGTKKPRDGLYLFTGTSSGTSINASSQEEAIENQIMSQPLLTRSPLNFKKQPLTFSPVRNATPYQKLSVQLPSHQHDLSSYGVLTPSPVESPGFLRERSKFEKWRRIILVICLISIFFLEGSEALLDSTLPRITDEKTSLKVDNFRISLMLGFGNLSSVLGKLMWGFLLDSDMASSKTWFLLGLLAMSLMLFLFGTSQSFGMLACSWLGYTFFYAMPWPVITKILYEWNHTAKQQNMAMTLLSLVESTAQFAIIISAATIMDTLNFTWRNVYHLYPLLLLGAALGAVFFIKSSPSDSASLSRIVQRKEEKRKESRLDGKTQLQALWMILSSGRFWAMSIGSGLAASFLELQALLPLYFKDEKQLTGSAPVYASVPFYMGLIVALVYTQPYAWMKTPLRMMFIALLNVILVGSFVLMALWTQMHIACSMALFFLVSYTVSWLYHVPPNLYTMKGAEHIGKLSSMQECVHFFLVFIFDIVAGVMLHDSQWTNFFILCGCVAMVSGLSYSVYFLLEMRAERKARRRVIEFD